MNQLNRIQEEELYRAKIKKQLELTPNHQPIGAQAPDDPVAAKEIAEFHEVWVNQLQPELARLSTNGKQIVVENSDHGIIRASPWDLCDCGAKRSE